MKHEQVKSNITWKIININQWSLSWECKNNSILAYLLCTSVLKLVIYSNLMFSYLEVFPVVPARDDLMGRRPMHSHRYSCLKEPTLGLMLCCGHRKILNFFTRGPIFGIDWSGTGSWLCHPFFTCPWASHLSLAIPCYYGVLWYGWKLV